MKARESWIVRCPDCFGTGDKTEAEVRDHGERGCDYIGKRVGPCETCHGSGAVDVEISRALPVAKELAANHG